MRLWTLHLVLALAGAAVTLALVNFPRVTLPGDALRNMCAAPTDSLGRDTCAEALPR